MLPYYILIFLPILPLVTVIKGQNRLDQKRNAIDTFFAVYLLMLALRHESIGRDIHAYKILFSQYSTISWQEILLQIEPGFASISKIINMLGGDFRWVMLLSAIVSVVPIWITYRRANEDPFLAIVIFIVLPTFVMPFSGLRQAMAIGLGCVAYELTKQRKLILFLLTVLLAMYFHFSAFMLFFMYPLYHVRITPKWLLAVIPAMAAIFVFNEPIFKVLHLLIQDVYEAEITENGAYMMLILFSIFGVFAFVVPDEAEMNEESIGLRNILLMTIVLQMFVPLHNLAMRMNYYYIIFIPILIPKIIKLRSYRWGRVAVAARYVLMIYLIIYFFSHMPSGNILDTFPYKFFWENML